MKKFLSYLLIAALGFAACLYLHKCTGPGEPPAAITAKLDSVKVLKQLAAGIAAKNAKLTADLKSQLMADSIEDIEYDNKIRAIRNKLAQTKSRIDTIKIDMNDPVLDSTFQLYDNVVEIQALKIDSLKADKVVIVKRYEFLLKGKDEELLVTRQVNQNMDEVVGVLINQGKEDKKKIKLLKWVVIPGAFVGGLLVGKL